MKLIYGVKDRPKPAQTLLFALQQLLAILAATIAVPIAVNEMQPGTDMSISAALFGAGAGTIVYQLFTKFKSPVFLGSSFAFIGSMAAAFAGAATVSMGYLGLIIGAAVFALGAKALFNESIDGTSIPLACAAGVAAFSAVFALFLPATPPKAKGEPMSVTDALGLRAFGMLKDRNIAIFMACVVVWTVAFTIYWMYGSFLASLGVKNITPTLNVGQISELVFMVSIPVAIKFLGFKATMALGILAMFLRYLMSAFAPEAHGLYWGAIAVHGAIFGYFFVAAQMYIDKKAPADIKAQGQGLYFFFYGVAQIVGTFFSTWLIDVNTASAAGAQAATNWQGVFLVEAAISGALLLAFLLFFKNDVKESA